MTRRRARFAAAVSCALIGAGGLGVGILAALPIMEAILGGADGPRATLSDLVQRFNDSPPLGLPLAIPPGVASWFPDGSFSAIVVIMCLLGVITILSAAANFLHAYFSLGIVFDTVTTLRRKVYARVIRMPLALAVRDGAADAISRLVNDTTQLAQGLNALLSRAVAQTLKGVVAFGVALIIDWRLTLFACVAAPALALTIQRLSRKVRRASRRALEHQAELYAVANEALQGLRVVKVHTTERHEVDRFHVINRRVMRQLLRARTARALMSPLNEVITLFALGLMTIIATKLILDGHMSPSNMILALGALGIAGAALKPLSGIINEIQQSAAAADRVEQLLNIVPEPGHTPGLPRLAPHSRSIELRDITFTYKGAETPALRGVDLTIRHGETVAIVGPNGSGKTTLLSLIPRLLEPDSGAMLVDGVDISTVNIRSLRHQIGVVTQDVVIFEGTIRDNIAYGSKNATDQAVFDAAIRARADGFIREMPGGYGSVVGERGATLSGGQRQRIAIARAILRDPRILILDEATSMIDADSEAQIAQALAEFSSGRTCLIVAHRLSTVVSADRIVVLDRGRVVDEGSHTELLDRCETYRLIARRQLVGAS